MKLFRSGPQPTKLEELQSFFFVIANYYSKFVLYFAKIAAPLYKLLHKDILWI